MESKKDSNIVTAFVDTSVPEQVFEQKETTTNTKDYISFGSDNLYPQALAALYRKSIALRGVIKSKVTYCVGSGFQIDENKKEGLDFINQVNGDGVSLDDLYEIYSTDRFALGNTYLEVVTDSKKSFVYFYNVQSVKCRYTKDKKSVIIHPDWSKRRIGDNLDSIIPVYPNFSDEDGLKRSIIHVKDYEPDFNNYGVADYIAAMDAAAIGYKTNKWNVSRLDNSFQTSGVLIVDGNMSDDDAKQLKKDFKDEMTGEGNQGKVFMVIKKMGGEGTKFEAINSNTEGDWGQLHSQSNDDIIIACGWKKSLAGITESTGFDTDRILNDYQAVKSSFIIKEQNKFIKIITRVSKEVSGLDLEGLSVINSSPVSMLTKLTADRFTRIWEAKKMAGQDYDPENKEEQRFLVESKDTEQQKDTVSAIQAIKNKLGL